MKGRFIIRDKTKIKVITPINILVSVLAFVGGWVNIIGYNVFMHTRPSSMTGRAAEIAESLGRGELKTFVYLVLVVLLFVLGVIIASIITERFGFTQGLMFVVAILVLNLIIVNADHNLRFFSVLLSMAMGAQNGATSLTSISRTTHMSGATTELGISIAFRNWNKAIFWGIRWLFYPLGGFLAYIFMKWLDTNSFNESFTLVIPIIIILCTAFIQKKFIDVEMSEHIKAPETKNKYIAE